MKLTDLRDELNARAETTDETPDLLAGVRAKITRTKRRRAAGAAGTVGGIAIVAAFATGLIPGLTTTTPQPADDPTPHDQMKGDVVIRAFEGEDRLMKGWIGDLGENKLDFSWTPQAQDARFEGICKSGGTSAQYFTVSVNDYIVGTSECGPGDDPTLPGSGIGLQADNALWLVAPAGKPAHVVVQLTNAAGAPVKDTTTQLALGIYHSKVIVPAGPPTQALPTSTDDYVKDGIRYRAKIGGRTLVAALVADRGKNQFDFTFTATGRQLSFNPFCTATSAGESPKYQTAIKVDGQPDTTMSCSGDSVDAGLGSYTDLGATPPAAGQEVKVTVRFEDTKGRLVDRPQGWIGLGIYDLGKQRTIDTTTLEEVTEYNGHNYRLAKLESVAASAGHLELATPADTPFLVVHGSTADAGADALARLTGLGDDSANQSGGYGTTGRGARPAGTAKLTLTDQEGRAVPHPTGKLFLALYLPE